MKTLKGIRYHGFFRKKEINCILCEYLIETGMWCYKDLRKNNVFCRSCAGYIADAILYGIKKGKKLLTNQPSHL